MAATVPVLSFVIPVRDAAEHLRRCLASIERATRGIPHEIVVGDNGSADESSNVARAAGARVLKMPGRSVAEMRNVAASVARGKLLAFVDSDHELDAGWASAALELLNDKSVVAAGAQYHAPSGGTWVQCMCDRMRRHQPGTRDVDWLPSGNLIVRRAVFERIGGFDSSLETCEDVDLCYRLTATGRLVASDRLRSVHVGDPKTLKALFLGELWRGRDNLRVSLRAPLTFRSMPSLAFPVLNLLALTAISVGILTWQLGGALLVALGSLAVATLVAVRASSFLANSPSPALSSTVAVQAVLVAAVYDVARALALVTRSGHGVRRRG